MRRRGWTALLAAAALLGTLVLGTTSAPAAGVARNPELQARIAAVAQARDEQQLEAALDSLRHASAPDFADLVPQLALFLLEAKGERAGMTPAVIVSRLGVSPEQILRAIEPYLDESDPALRAQLENLLDALELAEIGALLARREEAPSAELVRYLYRRSPAEAVAALGAGDGRASTAPAREEEEPLTVVERARAARARGTLDDAQRSRAAAALAALARDPDWRLRAYAAAVARAEPELAGDTAALRDRLAADPEGRVRAVVE